jgi:hypothetical protein
VCHESAWSSGQDTDGIGSAGSGKYTRER